jgi:hypothetical protein
MFTSGQQNAEEIIHALKYGKVQILETLKGPGICITWLRADFI